MAVTSNLSIEEFNGEKNYGFQRIFFFFSSGRTTPFLNFLKMIKRKGGHYPFKMLNTDRSKLPGTHWWSILNIIQKGSCFYLIAMGF